MRSEFEPGLGEPSPDRVVHRPYPDDRLIRLAPGRRDQGEGPALPAAEAPMRAHELLEGCDLVCVWVVHAVDEDVGAMREPVGAPQVVRGIRPEVAQGILAGHRLVAEAPASVGAEDDRAVIGPDHHETDTGVTDEGADQARVHRLDLAEGKAVRRLWK